MADLNFAAYWPRPRSDGCSETSSTATTGGRRGAGWCRSRTFTGYSRSSEVRSGARKPQSTSAMTRTCAADYTWGAQASAHRTQTTNGTTGNIQSQFLLQTTHVTIRFKNSYQSTKILVRDTIHIQCVIKKVYLASHFQTLHIKMNKKYRFFLGFPSLSY